jgi:hypothetical protein
MAINREYKSSVFALLFSDKARLLELYNAIEGTDYRDADDIEINTLQDALFLGRVNDVSFLFRKRLVVLIEHQSTVSPNLALRMLLYISRLYESMVESKRLYSRRPIEIPAPRFIILYNGKEKLPAKTALRLSDLFTKVSGHDKMALELEATVYNINKGQNPGIEGRSGTLDGYAELVARIRENREGGLGKEEAVSEAVSCCKRRGILYDFLCRHGSEVENMLWNDCTLEDVIELRREEDFEAGRDEARRETAKALKAMGLSVGQIAMSTKLSADEIAAL